MAQVAARLDSISQTMKARDDLDAARRQVDDERDEKADKAAVDLRERMDRHGTRTTALETNWAAFFGPIGVFSTVVKDVSTLTQSMSEVKEDVGFVKGAATTLKWGIPVIVSIGVLILGILGFFLHERKSSQSMISGGSNVTVSQSTGVIDAR